MAGSLIVKILRGIQFLLTLLIMAIDGNIIALARHGNPSEINFAMFTAVFSMITLFIVILSWRIHIPHIAILIMDGLNVLFFFAAGVALAVALRGAHSCGDQDYTKHNKITNGAANQGKRCHSAQAVTAFIWFDFAFYIATLVLTLLHSGNEV